MNLVVDTGNTKTKIGIFDNKQLIHTNSYDSFNINTIKQICAKYKIKNSIHSYVSDRNKNIDLFLLENYNHIIFNQSTPIPIKLNYKTPLTLGLDRISGIVGAFTIFPKKNVLVIDAGSAITFDLLDSNGLFIGGNISPGLKMRFRALNYFTNKLPLVDYNTKYSDFGIDTTSAIISGVQRGIVAEINDYIYETEIKYHKLKIIITGGDCFFFDKILKKPIFAEPFLVLIGLNRIINYNV